MKKILTLFILITFGISFTACSFGETTNNTTTNDAPEDNVTITTATTTATTTNSTTQTTTTTTTFDDTIKRKEEPAVIETTKNKTALQAPTKPDSCSLIPNKGDNGEWIPVFCDEFNGSAVDTNNWNYQTGGGGWGNGEAQYYTNGANTTVEDGELNIHVRKEVYGSNQYTSSRINTANKFDFKYGRVDVRAKLPFTQGTWPAIWMMPTDGVYGGWPYSGEIDIMEHTFLSGNQNKILGTIHTGRYYHINNNQIGSGFYRPSADFSVTTYHEYSIIWNEYSMTWLIDNVPYFTLENNNKLTAGGNINTDPYMYWPFDQEFHIILNVAVGGGLGGAISNALTEDAMVVDYVRVYQQDYVTGDAQDPTTIGEITNYSDAPGRYTFSWEQATDDKRIKGYNVYLDGKYIGYTERNIYRISGIYSNTEYYLGIEPIDYSGNVGTYKSHKFHTTRISTTLSRIESESYIEMSGIKLENCSDSYQGKNICWIDPNDFVTYEVQVNEAGSYTLSLRHASATSLNGRDLSPEGSIELYINGEYIGTTIVPRTGGWQVWQTLDIGTFNVESGPLIIKLIPKSEGMNMNYLSLVIND